MMPCGSRCAPPLDGTRYQGQGGYDGGKIINGRKRHLIVDSLGLVMKAFVTEANYQDREVASWLVPLLPTKFTRLKNHWANGGYTGEWLTQLPDDFPIEIEIVEREPGQRGFKIVPFRWS